MNINFSEVPMRFMRLIIAWGNSQAELDSQVNVYADAGWLKVEEKTFVRYRVDIGQKSYVAIIGKPFPIEVQSKVTEAA